MPVTFRHPDRSLHLGSTATLSRKVRALLLDTGGIFYDDTVWHRWLIRVLSGLGLHTNYRSFFHLWNQDFLADVHRGRLDFREAFEQFLLSAGLTRAQIDEVRLSCESRRNLWNTSTRLLPGVKTTLTRLHDDGILLGVLCNSEYRSEVLSARLARLGLKELFTTVNSSVDLRHVKPEAISYQSALKNMGLDADEVAFVGHDTAELDGASDVGMTTIALNFDAEARADVYLNRFAELLELFRSRQPDAAAG